MLRISPAGAATALVAALTGPAFAQSPYVTTIIHVNTPGHPTNVVPGLPGMSFKAGNTTTAFGRPILSQNGLYLGINCTTTEATAVDDVLIVNGALVLKEGNATPWPTASENVGTIDEEFGINNAGDLLIGNNTSATVNDDYVVLFQSGTWTVLAQEAGLVSTVVPGLLGDAGLTATWDDTIDSVRLTNSGLTLWRATGIDNLTTGLVNDAIVHLGGGLALQKGVDVPANQAGGASATWESFDLEDVNVSPDGSLVMVQGDLTGATTSDDVLVLNGVVVVQEGSPVAGFALPVNTNGLGIDKGWIDGAGNWYVRGNNTDATDWVLRNGVLVAQSDGTDEIVAGSGEHWDDATFGACFFGFDGNALGHFVICGVTDHVDPLRNGVIVFDDGLSGRYVVVREGDPVDLDGNGLFDDDRFYNTFGNDDTRLLDDGTILFTATLRTGAGTAVDQGFFRLIPTSASCTFRNGSGINPIALTCNTLPIVGTNWQIGLTSGPNTIATYLYADPTPIPAFPIFGGELLIAPTAFLIPTSINLPYAYQGLLFSLQGLRLDFDGVNISLVLTNAQDAVLGG